MYTQLIKLGNKILAAGGISLILMMVLGSLPVGNLSLAVVGLVLDVLMKAAIWFFIISIVVYLIAAIVRIPVWLKNG